MGDDRRSCLRSQTPLDEIRDGGFLEAIGRLYPAVSRRRHPERVGCLPGALDLSSTGWAPFHVLGDGVVATAERERNQGLRGGAGQVPGPATSRTRRPRGK